MKTLRGVLTAALVAFFAVASTEDACLNGDCASGESTDDPVVYLVQKKAREVHVKVEKSKGPDEKEADKKEASKDGGAGGLFGGLANKFKNTFSKATDKIQEAKEQIGDLKEKAESAGVPSSLDGLKDLAAKAADGNSSSLDGLKDLAAQAASKAEGTNKLLSGAKDFVAQAKDAVEQAKATITLPPAVVKTLPDATVATLKSLGIKIESSESNPGGPPPSNGSLVGWFVITVVLLALAGYMMSSGADCTTSMCVAEFVGTFMLVFSVGCNVLVGNKTWGVTSIACTLTASIYALGGVSGANFNPAVSIGLGILGKMSWQDVNVYVLVQLAAGSFAAASYSLLLGQTTVLAPAAGFSWWQAGLAEMLYTCLLVFVVLNTACSKKHAGKEQFYGLAIGFVIVAGGYGAGSISGGCFNPAVALAIDAFQPNISTLGLYIAFELLGCVIACILYRQCRPGDLTDDNAEEVPSFTSKLLSEFIGTYFLVLTVGLNVISGSPAGAFSIAAALMSVIFALGSVSGANFNPAVTIAIACRSALPWFDAITYIIVQVIGGIAAAFTYVVMLNGKSASLQPATTRNEALVGELVFTFLLCFVVLSVATVNKPLSEYFGFAIGATIIAGGYAIGNLSGGSLNPAVSAGIALSDHVMNAGPIKHVFTYGAAEIVGGMLAAAVFKVTHPDELPPTARADAK